MTEQNKQSSQPFAWYWHDQHGCLYITGDDRKPDLPADAQPLYATEQNKQSDTPAPSQHLARLNLTEWERSRLAQYVAGNALTYMGHHARGGLKTHEIEEMERWEALSNKLKTPSPETKATEAQ